MRYRLLEKFLILFCIIFLILIVLPLSKVLAGTLPANWDWNRPAEGYYGDGDGRTTDRDIALWTQDPNWFSDAGGWNPNNLIGKTTDSFYISSGTRDPRATINQRGAFCVGHLNSTGHPVIEYYTITNIVDVDTVSVFNKNVNDGKSNWAGWPGGVISYGTSSPNTIYNKVIWSTSNDGAANAVKLGYLATNSFINNEKINNSMSSYKSALQFLVVNGASSWTNTVSGLGLHNSFGASKDNTSNTGVMREAQDYLNRVRAYKFEDGTTGTPKVNISGEKSYIGPYKITTQEGNIVSAKVVSTDGKNTYSVVGISSSVGGAVQNISNITSGSSFYIVVNSQVSSKVNVSITKNFNDGIRARMYFLHGGYNNQNLLAFRGEKVTFANTLNLKTANSEDNASLKITKVDSSTSAKLSDVAFKLKNVDLGKWVKQSGNTTSYVDKEDDATEFKTKNGEVTISKLKAGKYIVKETKNPNDGYIASTVKDTEVTLSDGKTTPVTIKNPFQKGNFDLEKVDKDDESIKLDGVEFTLRCTKGSQEGKYVGLRNGEPYYSTSQVTLKTDSKGKISITGIWVGTYELKEIKNPHYGYATSTTSNIVITSRGKTTKKVTNDRKYVKISGYVWEDKQYDDGKLTMRNDLYKDIADDKEDELISGIKVYLMEGNTQVKTTTTNSNGAYLFENVEKDKLPNYSVVFEYDGLIYENVVTHFDKVNGSKAKESTRQEFNNRFAEIVKGNSESQVVANSASPEEDPRVNYAFEKLAGGRNAKIESTENCTITASTKDAGYTFKYDPEQLDKNDGEIKNINLGIYERAQADLALQDQLEEVKIEIAGYGHIYKYGQNYDANDEGMANDSWNVGVRFQNPYKNVYKRAVYKADANYENAENPSEELQMSLTYKITIANQSTLTTKVNKIVDYFDSRFELEAIGTGVDGATGEITGKLTQNQYRELNGTYKGKNGEDHTKIEIDVNKLIASSTEEAYSKKTQEAIYIQFNLPREVIVELLNKGVNDGKDDDTILQQELQQLERDGDSLQNKAEISSFTSYADAQGTVLYAAVDADSVPDNCTLSDESTYEDDTDKASSLAIVIANARQINGTVFEDLENAERAEKENISEGDSQFDPENENAIGGVKVQLVDEEGNPVKVFDERKENADGTTGAWTDINVETTTGANDENGKYTISGFIPGKYKVKFIWGDGTYKIVDGTKGDEYESMIENYKSTVINQERYNQISNNDKFYRETYKENPEDEIPMNSYAIDDLDIRETIDSEYRNYSFKSETPEEVTNMESYTPTLEINIEYKDDDLTSITYERVTERVVFTIDSINFGIIRRPKQTVDFVKTLCDIKFTLANGQVLIDAQIDENGNITGTKPYITYMAPTKENGVITENGFLKIEIDNSLLQGSTAELKYQLKTTNTSQSDYLGETGELSERYGYYQFGESYYESDTTGARKNADVLKISPTAIVDYLDETTVYEPDNETNIKYEWRAVTISEMERNQLVDNNVIASLKGENYETTDINGNPVNTNEDIGEKQIYTTDYFKDKKQFKPRYLVNGQEMPPDTDDLYMVVSKVINSEDDANFQNQAEIIGIDKNIGGKAEFTPGNYIPNAVNKEMDDSATVETSIVPSMGENRAYILPIIVLVVAFVLLGVGIYLIIVKIMKKER